MPSHVRPETKQVQKEGYDTGIREAIQYLEVRLGNNLTQTVMSTFLNWANRHKVSYTDSLRQTKQTENYKRGVIRGRKKVYDATVKIRDDSTIRPLIITKELIQSISNKAS